MSDQSSTGLSDRSAAAQRPFGTLNAADVGARGGAYQMPFRAPPAGLVNFSAQVTTEQWRSDGGAWVRAAPGGTC